MDGRIKYNVEFTDDAKEDAKLIQKSYPISIRKKLTRIILELSEHPRTGIGKPEKLKHSESWSRRLTEGDRIEYEIKDDVVIVLVISCLGHYDDK